ncbi:MAG: helix-turn-helix domain-containing protein [Moraxella sp.]|nr:helix-turn-helix domain-containing protein [Moraxella sp.]
MFSQTTLDTVLQFATPNCAKPSHIDGLWLNYANQNTYFSDHIQLSSINFCLHGTLNLFVNQTWQTISVGDMVFTPIHLPVSANFLPKNQNDIFLAVHLQLDETVLMSIINQLPHNKSHPEQTDHTAPISPAIADCISRLIALLPQENPQFLANLYIQELYCHLLYSPFGVSLAQLVSPNSVLYKIKHICRFIDTHFHQSFRVGDLAKLGAWGESQFYHHFKHITGLSPIAYQKMVRLNHAKSLILNKGLTISQVAYEVGYESVSQFSREYKRQFGISPSLDK